MRRGDEKKNKVERFGVKLEKNLEIDATGPALHGLLLVT